MTARRVAVALSGGVDSAVAAAMLVERGDDVFALMLRLHSTDDEPSRCCSPDDMALARRVAAHLSIPLHIVPAAGAFEESVVATFLRGYTQGRTPNPCIACNRTIRWGLLLDHALALGATHLATGHYARTTDGPPSELLRGIDPGKDQSYVLAFLSQAQLTRAVFPLGELTKPEVRQLARDRHLPVSERRESQDLCFIPSGDYRAFLRDRIGELPPGPILDLAGRQIGTHTGLADFTIGQRKGIGVPGPDPLFVLRKDAALNALVVGPRTALARDTFSICDINWIAGEPPGPKVPLTVRVRYHDREIDARFEGAPEEGRVRLAETTWNITPGQAAVFYAGQACLGGGIILE
jgi:tRNA-specific 2-thiouridylase